MRIACPACDTAYDVPDARLRPGRPVRCARCSHEWEPAFADPTLESHDAAVPVSDHGAENEPALEPTGGAPSSLLASAVAGPDKRLRAAWIASGVALVLLFGAAILGRNAVMSGWPASQRLYALFGMRPALPPVAPGPAKTANAAPPAHH